MSTLIITLPLTPIDAASLLDYVLSADGRGVDQQASAPLALLPLVGNTGEVVALVPAQYLSWHAVQLPKGTLARRFYQEGSTARLRAVLEGLLEDRLLDDTALLHFAIEPTPRPDALVWVAVCARAWLKNALLALEQAGRPVSRIVPEFTPDLLPDALYVNGTPDEAQLVFNHQGALSVWPLSAASAALLRWPDSADVVAEPAVAARAEQLFGRAVTLQQRAPRLVQASQSAWDLAQFDLLNSSRARTLKRASTVVRGLLRAPHWRAARVALLTIFLVNLVGLNAWAWKEKAGLQAQRLAIRAVLTSTFPQIPVIVDAPLQMARELAVLQQASGAVSGRDLEAMLSAFGAVAPVQTTLGAIEFEAGAVHLKGLTLTPEDLNTVIFKLKPLGFEATAVGDSLRLTAGDGS